MRKILLWSALVFTSLYVTGQTLLDTALNFSVKDTYGNSIDLYDKLDQDFIVVIDFFSTA